MVIKTANNSSTYEPRLPKPFVIPEVKAKVMAQLRQNNNTRPKVAHLLARGDILVNVDINEYFHAQGLLRETLRGQEMIFRYR